MKLKSILPLAAAAMMSVLAAQARAETTLTIATVNNPDMIVMQKYSKKFEEKTGIKLKWLVLEENVLRQRVTTDISTKGGQFDIITIGMYETPIWGKNGWLVPFDDVPKDYDLEDVLASVRNAPLVQGQALLAAVLRRKHDDVLPDRPLQGGRPHHAREADLGPGGRVRLEDHRQVQADLRHLPARPARLGREHGDHGPLGQHLRRPALRHGLEVGLQ